VLIALTLGIFIPLLFWVFDVLVKVLGSYEIDGVGADLCLLGISFNGSTLLTSAMSTPGTAATAASAGYLSAVTGLSLAVSLLIYIFAMIVLAPDRGQKFPALFNWLRRRRWKIILTIFLGFVTVGAEIGSYVLVIQGGGRP
jgi:succinate dehydrogenase hydrophobic anchor subunit